MPETTGPEQTTGLASDQSEKDEDHQHLALAMMRRQGGLSLKVALVFLGLIFGIPIVNWLMPGVANQMVGGFTLTWLFLGILFYPITWVISAYFVRASDSIESDIASSYREEGR